MRILGIDYGTKRVGLAVSDETKTFARELNILAPKDFWREINKVIEENQISEIVAGLPLNMSGQDSEKTLEVRSFTEKLKQATGLPVYLMDERLSSAMTKGLPGGSKNIDSLAAQIILQNYLDKNKKNEPH